MKTMSLGTLALRARLFLMARGPLWCGALLLLLGAGATLAWLLHQRALQVQREHPVLRCIIDPVVVKSIEPLSTRGNLTLFYDTLGEQRYAEQQVKTLFGLAAKAGLTLRQGEYKSAYDRNARIYTYQVTLPVKGSYDEVSNFSLMALRAIPFASLDELSFKRENIGDTQIEARVRLTLFLADQPQRGAP